MPVLLLYVDPEVRNRVSPKKYVLLQKHGFFAKDVAQPLVLHNRRQPPHWPRRHTKHVPPPQPYTRTPIGSQCDFNPLRLPHCDFNPIQDFDATSDFNPVATSTIAPFPPQSVHYYLDWAPARVPRSGAPERSEHSARFCCGGTGARA